jgi:hypothetical protein
MGIISTGPGSPLAFSSASGGKLYPFNALDAVTPQQVAPANPSRQQIMFHNPGAVDIFVYPQYKLSQAGVQSANAPTVAAPGGSFRIYANGGSLSLSGECSQAWYALAASSSTGALTVMDSNL